MISRLGESGFACFLYLELLMGCLSLSSGSGIKVRRDEVLVFLRVLGIVS